MRLTVSQVNKIAWGTALSSAAVSLIAWGQLNRWQFDSLNAFDFFPLFGLLAFNGMWTHYIAGFVRRLAGYDGIVIRQFFRQTSLAVLFFLLLHPGLLAWQLASSGLGFPPESYFYYVGESLRFWALLGIIAWLSFMLYELKRFFVNPKLHWLAVRTSDVAMVLIFFHGLKLGSHMYLGWFRWVWYFYGVVYLISLTYNYIHDRRKNNA